MSHEYDDSATSILEKNKKSVVDMRIDDYLISGGPLITYFQDSLFLLFSLKYFLVLISSAEGSGDF